MRLQDLSPPAGIRDAVAIRTAAVPPCQVVLAEITDQRPLRDGVANDYGRTITHDDVAAWVGARLLASAPGTLVQAGHGASGAGAPAPLLRLKLLKLHLSAVSTVRSANVVVEARLSRADGTATTALYRGRETGTNWFGSDSELRGAFEAAIANLAAAMAGDLGAACTPTAAQSSFSPAPNSIHHRVASMAKFQQSDATVPGAISTSRPMAVHSRRDRS